MLHSGEKKNSISEPTDKSRASADATVSSVIKSRVEGGSSSTGMGFFLSVAIVI